MKMLGMLCHYEKGEDDGEMIVCPSDNMWFVRRDQLNPGMAEEAKAIEAKGTIIVIGAIMQGE